MLGYKKEKKNIAHKIVNGSYFSDNHLSERGCEAAAFRGFMCLKAS